MAQEQILANLMMRLRDSRDVECKSLSMVSRKDILTVISCHGTHETTASEFLRHYPALMDPRKFLQLIAKYATKDILFWANSGRETPIVSLHNINELRLRAIKLMGERTPGGKDTLKRIIDIVKSHNRIDDPKHNMALVRPEVVYMCLDAWYKCISHSSTSDSTLPLGIPDTTAAQESLTLLLGTSGTQRVSLILSELLHDPLFHYCNILEISDHALLEWCASHSYRHVLDKLKVNNPCIKTTHENIKIRVEGIICPPALWAPEDDVESTAKDDDAMSIDSKSSLFAEDDDDDMEDDATQEPEYFQQCGCCLDNGMEDCLVNSDLRQPGQICSRCFSLGEFCEDRSPTSTLR